MFAFRDEKSTFRGCLKGLRERKYNFRMTFFILGGYPYGALVPSTILLGGSSPKRIHMYRQNSILIQKSIGRLDLAVPDIRHLKNNFSDDMQPFSASDSQPLA